MEYQSLSIYRLNKAIRKSDFQDVLVAQQDIYREKLLCEAINSVKKNFTDVNNPLSSFKLHGNQVYKIDRHHHRLIERSLTSNLKSISGKIAPDRTSIVENLKLLLMEGVPYRIYRWDIRKFFESFDSEEIKKFIDQINNLSPKNKILLCSLLEKHKDLGGTGSPRGLSLSSVLTELMMCEFDSKTFAHSDTFFYARYVDDIIVITSAKENSQNFRQLAEKNLPKGLQFNELKSQESKAIGKSLTSKKQTDEFIYSFEYLGYKISIKNKTDKNKHRIIDVDMADKKVERYKKRLSRAFYDFAKTGNTELLIDRLRFLTKNFKVYNQHLERTKLSGIYYNYPAIQGNMSNLKNLDGFIKALVLGRKGRLSTLLSSKLNSRLRSRILANSFVRGYKNIAFVTFTPERIGEIKRCWNY